MLTVVSTCTLLIALTTLLHYEVLRGLSTALPSLPVAGRAKLLVVILAAFVAHGVEIAMYGAALFVLVTWLGAGILSGSPTGSLTSFLYFSAETYTSLGFGDLTPVGPVRLLAGTEALNGLLLIGWSASFAHLAMERYWNSGSAGPADGRRRDGPGR